MDRDIDRQQAQLDDARGCLTGFIAVVDAHVNELWRREKSIARTIIETVSDEDLLTILESLE